MRFTVLLGALALFVPVVCSAQGVTAAAPPPAGPAVTQVASRATPETESVRPDALPVKRVVLYKNGVGYFEHLGRVRGNQSVTIDFTSGQLNDVLKSLTTLDLGNGRITAINYNSEAPLSQQLSALGLPLGAVNSVSEFFGALRGARLEARTPTGVISGRLLSVEKRQRTEGGRASQEIDELSIVSDTGEVRLVELSPAVSIRLADRDLNQQVGRYLGVVASGLQQSMRRMTISTAGTGDRPLFVSYVSEVPVWKTTYRLVVPSKADAKPFLQGWAIVDNTIGEDWTSVEMSLVAGEPQSFIQQISQPYYLRRPEVLLPESAQHTPQAHEAGLVGAPGTITGRVTDSRGGILPGVTVQAIGSGGAASLQVVSDSNGRYTLTVPAGTYQLLFRLAGFRARQVTDVFVAPGGTTTRAVTLEVGVLAETATVTAAPPEGVEPGRFRPSMVEESLKALQSAAAGRELGDLFEYRIKEPVTIRKNQSAMVPILNAEVGLEKVTLWNPYVTNAVPLRAVWLSNSTGLTLDGGNFLVLESEAFAGEGLMEPLKPGEQRLLSYAADTAIHVDTKTDDGPRLVERTRIANGVITQTVQERARRVYTVRNEDTVPRTIIIEHEGWPGSVLAAGTPQPVEVAGRVRRFRMSVEQKKTATLTVEETRPRDERVFISAMTDEQLTVFVRGSFATAPIQAALKPIIEKKQALAATARGLAARRAEMDWIATDQQRVRENMKALKGSAEEKALIQRYARRLDEQENRLEVLRKETADLEQQRTRAQAELEKLIEALTLDVTP